MNTLVTLPYLRLPYIELSKSRPVVMAIAKTPVVNLTKIDEAETAECWPDVPGTTGD